MILNDDSIVVLIGDMIFRSRNYIAPQYVFDPDAIQGFYDGVNVKRSDTVRPNQFGDFSEPGLLGPRHMSISGTAIARTPAELLAMRDRFIGLYVKGEYREISVINSSETRYVTATLDGQPSWVQKLDTVAVWKMELYAPDPRMYGPVNSMQITDSTVSGGMDYPMDYPINYGGGIKVQAVSMDNNGNTDSWPIFKVTGDFFQGFSITNNGSKKITYEGVVTINDPVTIDTGAGTAMQGGVDKSSQLSRRDWFSIPPNSSIQPMFYPKQDAVGWCDIMYRDTWI